METKVFYRCSTCGNLIGMIRNSGVVPRCCGQAMEHLEPCKTDAQHEKHVPVISCEGKQITITIGELPHPMTEAHYIEWIYLQTDRGGHMRLLLPGDAPTAYFTLCRNEQPLCAYAYCNLHDLWSADCKDCT